MRKIVIHTVHVYSILMILKSQNVIHLLCLVFFLIWNAVMRGMIDVEFGISVLRKLVLFACFFFVFANVALTVFTLSPWVSNSEDWIDHLPVVWQTDIDSKYSVF